MLPPLHVVHAAGYFAPAWGFGGPPRSLLALCRALVADGMAVEMFTTTASPGRPLEPAPDGRDVDGVTARYFPVSWPARLLGSPAMAVPLARAMASADVVHLHGLFNRTVWMASRLARDAGVPVVVSPRGMLAPAARGHHAWRKRVAWYMRDAAVMAHAACWHATSHAEADDLRALDRSAHVVEIPNVVPELAAGPADVDRARDAAGIRQGGRYVLYLGRIHPLKRLDRLAEAFLGLRAEFDDLDLVLAGPDESGHRARVAPCFVAAGPRVHWIGAVDDAMKAGLLAGAAVLVLCSDTESFGMSVAEALSVGTPVVVTRTCPWPVVEREGFGAWVDPTPAALADGLRRVLRDPHAARLMGARGRAYARAAFAPGVVAAQWRQVYETLAAGHARPA